MPEREINDTVIAYEEAGNGPPLVLAHGLGQSRAMWRPQIEHVRTSNRVIAFDARGAGESFGSDVSRTRHRRCRHQCWSNSAATRMSRCGSAVLVPPCTCPHPRAATVG